MVRPARVPSPRAGGHRHSAALAAPASAAGAARACACRARIRDRARSRLSRGVVVRALPALRARDLATARRRRVPQPPGGRRVRGRRSHDARARTRVQHEQADRPRSDRRLEARPRRGAVSRFAGVRPRDRSGRRRCDGRRAGRDRDGRAGLGLPVLRPAAAPRGRRAAAQGRARRGGAARSARHRLRSERPPAATRARVARRCASRGRERCWSPSADAIVGRCWSAPSTRSSAASTSAGRAGCAAILRVREPRGRRSRAFRAASG